MALLDRFFQTANHRPLVQQIIDHLSRLLNTKCGYGAWQEHFGLEGYNGNFSHYQLAQKVIVDMRRTIERYEKRIVIQSIEPVVSRGDLSMRFRIHCKIGQQVQRLTVEFENKKEQITVEVEDGKV